jgi:RNA polymerase sigma factor (sigma-70 family)
MQAAGCFYQLQHLEKTTDIIRGCISGSEKHQRLLYEQYRGFALKVAFRYIYTLEKATDVVNDSFVKLFNHFHSFRPGADADNEKILMGWLKKIVINTSIDCLRKEQMLPEIGGIPESGFEIADNAGNADQQALYRDLIILVKQLPPSYRLAFNLYVIDGYSHAEIASIMGTSISNSKSNLSRARAILQNGVKKMEEEKICRI